MKTRDLVDLLLLAALWGAAFLFMRIAAPTFGPVGLVEVRVSIAAVCLLALLWRRGGLPLLGAHARPLLMVGVLHTALPFVLFSYAVLSITGGLASILNATTPMWTALVAFMWLRERFRAAQWLGLAVGLAGVVVLVWGKVDLHPGGTQWSATLAVAAGLLGATSYGVAGNYTRRYLTGVNSLAVATGSQVGAALVLLPFAIALWPHGAIDARAWAAAIALGIGCTALAYILYFRLLANVGAVRALAVTFLLPLFAVFWGGIFLDEPVSAQMLGGGAIILLGTALALGLVGAPRPAAAATR
ncbi:MAG: DMT family transporter [Gemmatimonadota bacterium]